MRFKHYKLLQLNKRGFLGEFRSRQCNLHPKKKLLLLGHFLIAFQSLNAASKLLEGKGRSSFLWLKNLR